MEKKRSHFWVGFAIGAIICVVVWYWQKSTAADEGALDLLDAHARARAKIRDLQATATASLPKSEPASEEVEEPAPAAQVTVAPPAVPDDLTQIKGIGPVYAQRLQEAGLATYAALAAASPQQVADVVGRKSWQAADPADWIAAAAQMADAA